MTHELNMMDYHKFLRNKNLSIKPGDIEYGTVDCFNKSATHYDFLKSPPKLGDFVPTNEDGEVMEKPEEPPKIRDVMSHANQMMYGLWDEYQSALDRCLWKGWERDEQGNNIGVSNKSGDFIPYFIIEGKLELSRIHTTYEQLITSGVKLERIQKK